jgi:hypothetical protein
MFRTSGDFYHKAAEAGWHGIGINSPNFDMPFFDSPKRPRRESGKIAFTRKPVRAGMFVETGIKNPKLRQERNRRK